MRDRGRSYVDPEQRNSREFGTNELPSKDTHIAALEAELATLRAAVEKAEWERDDAMATVKLLQQQLKIQNDSFAARLSETTERAERAEEAFEIADEMRLEATKQLAAKEAELAETASALWRIPPNMHTIPCEANGFAEPDPFEGVGETYADAYTREKSRAEAAEAQLAEARKVLEALDRMNRGVDWCDQDEQARRWSAARSLVNGGEEKTDWLLSQIARQDEWDENPGGHPLLGTSGFKGMDK